MTTKDSQITLLTNELSIARQDVCMLIIASGGKVKLNANSIKGDYDVRISIDGEYTLYEAVEVEGETSWRRESLT